MKKTELYPLQFVPQYQYRLWGGNNFNAVFNRKVEGNQLGESWEISCLKDKASVVLNGPLKGHQLLDLIEQAPEALLGKKSLLLFGKSFPLLVKFIDAKSPLSVQVHPNDALAKERHNCLGKSEMWYVVEAEENATLTLGFNAAVTRDQFKQHQKENTLEEILHTVQVNKGDVVSVPAGLLHAIGGGVLLAEIQQASDITYRVYDHDRIDEKTGTKRELHHDLALDAIDFTLGKQAVLSVPKAVNKNHLLVDSPYFKTTFISVEKQYTLSYLNRASFSILICVDGEITLSNQAFTFVLTKGQTVLIPAVIEEVRLQGKADLLEVTL